jgi:hypothetical protein
MSKRGALQPRKAVSYSKGENWVGKPQNLSKHWHQLVWDLFCNMHYKVGNTKKLWQHLHVARETGISMLLCRRTELKAGDKLTCISHLYPLDKLNCHSPAHAPLLFSVIWKQCLEEMLLNLHGHSYDIDMCLSIDRTSLTRAGVMKSEGKCVQSRGRTKTQDGSQLT